MNISVFLRPYHDTSLNLRSPQCWIWLQLCRRPFFLGGRLVLTWGSLPFLGAIMMEIFISSIQFCKEHPYIYILCGFYTHRLYTDIYNLGWESYPSWSSSKKVLNTRLFDCHLTPSPSNLFFATSQTAQREATVKMPAILPRNHLAKSNTRKMKSLEESQVKQKTSPNFSETLQKVYGRIDVLHHCGDRCRYALNLGWVVLLDKWWMIWREISKTNILVIVFFAYQLVLYMFPKKCFTIFPSALMK